MPGSEKRDHDRVLGNWMKTGGKLPVSLALLPKNAITIALSEVSRPKNAIMIALFEVRRADLQPKNAIMIALCEVRQPKNAIMLATLRNECRRWNDCRFPTTRLSVEVSKFGVGNGAMS